MLPKAGIARVSRRAVRREARAAITFVARKR